MAGKGREIGYARVSTDDQSAEGQVEALRAAGCMLVFCETASGGSRSRPELAKALATIGPGDVLVVARIDRLARSLLHLLEIIERIEKAGGHFRSLTDPIDTTTPQGKFALQVLGAAAEFERALIRERTREGLRVARARGRIGGNPGLRAGDGAARRAVAEARDRAYVTGVIESMETWAPTVRRLRPNFSWAVVAKAISRVTKEPWSAERLQRAARRMVGEGLLDAGILNRSVPRRDLELPQLVAGLRLAAPDATLEEIGTILEGMRFPTPRGAKRWHASSVAYQLSVAARHGLLPGTDTAG